MEEGIDMETLFGKGVLPEHLNDDALAQALDRIGEKSRSQARTVPSLRRSPGDPKPEEVS
jgi:hypothetical protein